MTDTEQLNHFGDDLDRLIERYRNEYDISFAAVIGALTVKATMLTLEAREQWRKTEGEKE